MEIFTFILNNSNKCTQLNTLKAHFRALITSPRNARMCVVIGSCGARDPAVGLRWLLGLFLWDF